MQNNIDLKIEYLTSFGYIDITNLLNNFTIKKFENYLTIDFEFISGNEIAQIFKTCKVFKLTFGEKSYECRNFEAYFAHPKIFGNFKIFNI